MGDVYDCLYMLADCGYSFEQLAEIEERHMFNITMDDDWLKIIDYVRMELYADVVNVWRTDAEYKFMAWNGNRCETWVIPSVRFWGLSTTTDRINLCVDEFRQQTGKLGV